MNCYYHDGKEAVGGCVGCGHLVCADCKAMIGEKSYCKVCVDRLVTRMRLTETPVSKHFDSEPEAMAVPLSSVPTNSKPQKRASKMSMLTGVIVVSLIALVVGFVPLVEIPYTATVQYLETETYYEWVANPWVISELVSRGVAIGQVYYRVERERVVVKEREETRYKRAPLFNYVRYRVQG